MTQPNFIIRRTPLVSLFAIGLAAMLSFSCQQKPTDQANSSGTKPMDVANVLYVPTFKATSAEIDTLSKVFSIAVGDIASNLKPFKGGLLPDSQTCLYAGLDYYGPWARDGALSISNGMAMLAPAACHNTLISQLKLDKAGRLIFAGEYWDNLLQTRAHYDYYLATGDTSLIDEAMTASLNALADRERDEYDERYGLFRGAAGFNDGISGYPDLYANTGTWTEGGEHWVSNIKKWPFEPSNADKKAKVGFGLPLMALSTNCVHYQAYQTLPLLAAILGRKVDPTWATKAATLKDNINKQLWQPEKGTYLYFQDPNGPSAHQEGMGLALAISTGVASAEQAKQIMSSAHQTNAGMPCLWPGFSRYDAFKPTKAQTGIKHYPRHAQTVWTMVQSLWAHAAAISNDSLRLHHEVTLQAEHAFRDRQFMEIYHPDNRLPYGGVQEDNDRKLVLWESTTRQTWGASGYLRNLLQDVLGLNLTDQGILLKPNLSTQYPKAKLEGLLIRGCQYSFWYLGTGHTIKSVLVDGKPLALTGTMTIPYAKGPKCHVVVELQ